MRLYESYTGLTIILGFIKIYKSKYGGLSIKLFEKPLWYHYKNDQVFIFRIFAKEFIIKNRIW